MAADGGTHDAPGEERREGKGGRGERKGGKGRQGRGEREGER